MSYNRFVGKKAVVTGAGSGLGRAIALRLASEGAEIAVHDFNLEGGQETVAMIEANGGKAKAYKVDVADVDDVKKVLAETVDDFAAIDYLVCNAGVNKYCDIFDFNNDDWNRIINVNLTGVWNYCRYTSEVMAKNGGGAIVNTSSIAAFNSSHMRIPYSTSKGGVHTMTRAMALDLGKYNVRVNSVAPGPIDSNMTQMTVDRPGSFSSDIVLTLSPLHKTGKPEDVAGAVAFLLSEDASYITGANLVVDGGVSIGNTIGLPVRFVPKDGYEAPWLDEFDYVQDYKEARKKHE